MRILKPILTLLVLAAIVYFAYQWFIFPLFQPKAKVIHVMDADTLLVKENGKLKVVQLIGVDAPEVSEDGSRHQCFYEEAKIATAQAFSKTRDIELKADKLLGDTDIYLRPLRYVKVKNSVTVNEMLLQGGFAKVYLPDHKSFEQEKKYLQLESEAREKKVGLWSTQTCRGIF